MTSTTRTQPESAARTRRPGTPTSPDLERRLEAFLLIARRVGLS